MRMSDRVRLCSFCNKFLDTRLMVIIYQRGKRKFVCPNCNNDYLKRKQAEV